jgi:uncharacterized membrane protein AbrB (regulator of aidB expression)
MVTLMEVQVEVMVGMEVKVKVNRSLVVPMLHSYIPPSLVRMVVTLSFPILVVWVEVDYT